VKLGNIISKFLQLFKKAQLVEDASSMWLQGKGSANVGADIVMLFENNIVDACSVHAVG
jgi:hypothetical protein